VALTQLEVKTHEMLSMAANTFRQTSLSKREQIALQILTVKIAEKGSSSDSAIDKSIEIADKFILALKAPR